jgi:hypothetical protein
MTLIASSEFLEWLSPRLNSLSIRDIALNSNLSKRNRGAGYLPSGPSLRLALSVGFIRFVILCGYDPS